MVDYQQKYPNSPKQPTKLAGKKLTEASKVQEGGSGFIKSEIHNSNAGVSHSIWLIPKIV